MGFGFFYNLLQFVHPITFSATYPSSPIFLVSFSYFSRPASIKIYLPFYTYASVTFCGTSHSNKLTRFLLIVYISHLRIPCYVSAAIPFLLMQFCFKKIKDCTIVVNIVLFLHAQIHQTEAIPWIHGHQLVTIMQLYILYSVNFETVKRYGKQITWVINFN